MHINLHKTFSTPHGGGGPGAGPVVLSERPRPLRAAAVLRVASRRTGAVLVEDGGRKDEAERAAGPHQVAFHGQMGMFVRALAYMHESHGADGHEAGRSEDAVLNGPTT